MHEKMNCVLKIGSKHGISTEWSDLSEAQEPLQVPLKASSNTVILTKALLFCRNKPEAVEVTFAGKCLYLNPINRRHNIKNRK